MWLVIIGFTFAGLGCANIVPVAFSAAASLPGLGPGTGIAIATMFGYSGMLAGPAVFGFIGEAFGFAIVYLGFGIAMIFVLMLAAILPRGRLRG